MYSFAPQVKTIMVVVVATCALAIVAYLRGGRDPMRRTAGVLAIGSAAAVVVTTVTPKAVVTAGESPQLVPFHTIRRYVHVGLEHGYYQDTLIYVAGNVALLAPFGFFAYLALRRGLLAATVAGAALSLTVEILQLPIYTRTTDVDDLILNTVGAFGGALVALVLYRLWSWSRRSRGGAASPPLPTSGIAHHAR